MVTGKKCENCCRSCCYSTPLFTLTLLCFTGLGLVGFTLSGIYGVAKMDTLPHVENGTTLMAPLVCGAILVTILPLVLITIMSYCITGYIRDILFRAIVKSCIGSSCINAAILVMMVGYILLWVLIAVGLGGITAFYIQIDRFCAQRDADMIVSGAGTAMCLYYVDRGLNFFPICDETEVNAICSSDGQSVGLAYSISLIFTVIVVMGLVMLSLVHVFNHVSARDHIDYRESTRNEYDMKRVR